MENYKSITSEEFTYTEQVMKDEDFTDEAIHEKMNDLYSLFK